MFAVIFVVQPKAGQFDVYLNLANVVVGDEVDLVMLKVLKQCSGDFSRWPRAPAQSISQSRRRASASRWCNSTCRSSVWRSPGSARRSERA
jgi:hypothetical protein